MKEIVQRDALADVDVADAIPDRGDDAGDLVSERHGKIRLAGAGAIVRVCVTDARSMHVDDDLAGAGNGIIEGRELKRFA
jgi:hypothetical protein